MEQHNKEHRYRVLIVGSGDIGTRHLQALCTLKDIEQIDVVDPNPRGLALGKQRLSEVEHVNSDIIVRWLSSLDDAYTEGDLCIIATQAKIRPKVFIQVADKLGYKRFILEKIVAQSVNDYLHILDYSRLHHISTWVNCKTRAYPFHLNAKSKICDNPFTLSILGGNNGLGNNGVHAADLFMFYDGSGQLESSGAHIDQYIHESKRGSSIFDLSGTINAKSPKGNQLNISYLHNTPSYEHLTLISPTYRYVIDHMQRWGFESSLENNWKWQSADLSYNILISNMTREIVSSILNSGTCHLPSLSDCFPAHKFILDELLPHFQEMLKNDSDVCPIT